MTNNPTHGNGTQEFQDFFTPEAAAQAMAEALIPGLQARYTTTGNPVKVLEPSVGSGNLIGPLLASNVPMDVTCLDIQEWCLNHVVETARGKGYRVAIMDDHVVVSNY